MAAVLLARLRQQRTGRSNGAPPFAAPVPRFVAARRIGGFAAPILG
jgi:hypothetical protein